MGRKKIKYGLWIVFCTVMATLTMLAKLSGMSGLADRYGGAAVLILTLAILVLAIAERRNLK